MCVELNGKVWKKFVEFFREEKGYSDWTEQEIEDSRNDDDITEFIAWLVNRLESDAIVARDIETLAKGIANPLCQKIHGNIAGEIIEKARGIK